jgi:hypothetical protein
MAAVMFYIAGIIFLLPIQFGINEAAMKLLNDKKFEINQKQLWLLVIVNVVVAVAIAFPHDSYVRIAIILSVCSLLFFINTLFNFNAVFRNNAIPLKVKIVHVFNLFIHPAFGISWLLSAVDVVFDDLGWIGYH